MKPITQTVNGQLININGTQALHLNDDHPKTYLRYALTVRGTEAPIFPAFLLDDWGNEIRKLKLYTWLRENGEFYPRAEIFGFDANGNETQLFVRELELYWSYPCYLFDSKTAPMTDGILLNDIAISSNITTTPQQIKRPPHIKMPLRRARVTWWHIPTTFTSF